MRKFPKSLVLVYAMAAVAAGNGNVFDYERKTSPGCKPKLPKKQPKKLHSFNVKGKVIEAYSKKDAIKRYNHQLNNK